MILKVVLSAGQNVALSKFWTNKLTVLTSDWEVQTSARWPNYVCLKLYVLVFEYKAATGLSAHTHILNLGYKHMYILLCIIQRV